MDTASSFLLGHAASKAIDEIGDKFRSLVIERWSRRRAEVFFQQLCEAIAFEGGNISSEYVERQLKQFADIEASSEVLFEAYRRVVLAKSKELGPRIIALLTAELLTSNRPATDAEEAILAAAETLTDDEVLEFSAFVRDQQGSRNARYVEGGLEIEWLREERNTRRYSAPTPTGPLDLNNALGRWAVKLKTHGILQDDLLEREYDYEADSERHIDEAGHARELIWTIGIAGVYLKLVNLIATAHASQTRAAEGDLRATSAAQY